MGILPCEGTMRSQVCSKVLLTSFVVWFVVLFFAAKHLFSLKSASNVMVEEKDVDVKHRIEAANSNLQMLQGNLAQMKNILKKMLLNSNSTKSKMLTTLRLLNPDSTKSKIHTIPRGEVTDQKALDELFVKEEEFFAGSISNMSPFGSPRLQYELQRKKTVDDVREFWFYISSQLEKLQSEYSKTNPQLSLKLGNILKVAKQHKMSLTNDVTALGSVDGFAGWRESEARNLANIVQDRLNYLQNPENCSTAKKLVCSLNKGCGFGCQIHHAAYCLIVAYATKRTLILTSKGWRYHKNGWEDVFLPLSNTCLSPAGSSTATWPGKPDTQVLVLPIIDTLMPRPEYLPPAIPKDLAPRLIKFHNQPLVWWIGQMLKYLMRPQPSTSDFFGFSKEKLKFRKPIVGVHIRRTDKIGTEAAFHPIEEYMKHVNEWYEQQIQNGQQITHRSIYLATDDPKVIFQTRQMYPEYDVLGDPDIAKTAGIATRYSDNSLHGIMLDIHFLSLSDHLVCTFSSQVCRVAYEIMQTNNVDASDRFTSLDDVYYFGGQNGHSSVAILPHEPENDNELRLRPGDQISVAGNHWDGYSKGRNLRTNQVGLYPSFKVQSRAKIVEFPKYEEVPNTSK